jgi:hypothetical protein
MKSLAILAALLVFGCDSDCKDTEACKVYGQCINAEEPGRCITGCERMCLDEGRCTPHHHGDRVECVAKTRSACKDTRGCHFDGKCSPVGGKCLPDSNDDCKESVHCRWQGNCSEVKNVCQPVKKSDCELSMGCAMFGNCFMSFMGNGCIKAEARNIEIMMILGLVPNEEGN